MEGVVTCGRQGSAPQGVPVTSIVVEEARPSLPVLLRRPAPFVQAGEDVSLAAPTWQLKQASWPPQAPLPLGRAGWWLGGSRTPHHPQQQGLWKKTPSQEPYHGSRHSKDHRMEGQRDGETDSLGPIWVTVGA